MTIDSNKIVNTKKKKHKKKHKKKTQKKTTNKTKKHSNTYSQLQTAKHASVFYLVEYERTKFNISFN